MDSYVPKFQKFGGSMVMYKGRSQVVVDSCKKYGGFYLGSIGGVALPLLKTQLKKCLFWNILIRNRTVWKIEVENFPAFMVIDNQ